MKDDYNNYLYLSLHYNHNVSSVLSFISRENEKKVRFFHFKSQKREKVQKRQFSTYKETIFHIQIPRFQTEAPRLLFVSGRWPRRACACAPAYQQNLTRKKKSISCENLTFSQNCAILFSRTKQETARRKDHPFGQSSFIID